MVTGANQGMGYCTAEARCRCWLAFDRSQPAPPPPPLDSTHACVRRRSRRRAAPCTSSAATGSAARRRRSRSSRRRGTRMCTFWSRTCRRSQMCAAGRWLSRAHGFKLQGWVLHWQPGGRCEFGSLGGIEFPWPTDIRLPQVKSLADEYVKSGQKLHILVNNAGGMVEPRCGAGVMCYSPPSLGVSPLWWRLKAANEPPCCVKRRSRDRLLSPYDRIRLFPGRRPMEGLYQRTGWR